MTGVNLISRSLSLVTFSFLFFISNSLVAQSEITVDSENQIEINRIKTAYLYNFLKFIDLPPNQSTAETNSFAVCVLGKDPFGLALDAMSGRKAKGLIVFSKRVTTIAEARACNILYISESESERLDLILKSFEQSAILTVSDIRQFSQKGGIIGFVKNAERIGLEINLNNARKANIKISGLLLEIAEVIE